MEKEIISAVIELEELLKKHSDDFCTSVNIFINCEGYEIRKTYATPEQLEQNNMGMRNINGDFIS